MPRRNLGWLVGIAGFFALAVSLAWTAPPREDDEFYPLMRLMVDVLKEVDHRYEKKLTAEQKRKLIEDMINGGLERLDPHSAYIPPKEYKQLTDQTKGRFGGIGIQIEPSAQSGRLTVISPMPGTPAYKAGMLPGDIILKINGKATEDMRVKDAIEMIKGKEGEALTLNILHEGSKKAVDIELVRAIIKVQSVLGDVRKKDNEEEWEYFIDPENKIAYIRLIQFTDDPETRDNSAKELARALNKLKGEGMRGLVLDLRGNPGGLLTVAVDICRLFIPEGDIVKVSGRNHQEEVYRAKADEVVLPPEKFPMVVLINGGSASASEIVSAALQDHKRAVVVGERSYGKGSVQNIILMENKTSALKLTTARYWRPSGENIHRDADSKESDVWGVKPNEGFAVPLKPEEWREYYTYRRDRDIARGKGPTDPEKAKKPLLEADKPLQRAVEYLRGEIKKAGAALFVPERHEA